MKVPFDTEPREADELTLFGVDATGIRARPSARHLRLPRPFQEGAPSWHSQ